MVEPVAQPADLLTSGKEAKMNRVSKLSRTVAVVAAFEAAPTYAIQPGQTVNPNGFPSGGTTI